MSATRQRRQQQQQSQPATVSMWEQVFGSSGAADVTRDICRHIYTSSKHCGDVPAHKLCGECADKMQQALHKIFVSVQAWQRTVDPKTNKVRIHNPDGSEVWELGSILGHGTFTNVFHLTPIAGPKAHPVLSASTNGSARAPLPAARWDVTTPARIRRYVLKVGGMVEADTARDLFIEMIISRLMSHVLQGSSTLLPLLSSPLSIPLPEGHRPKRALAFVQHRVTGDLFDVISNKHALNDRLIMYVLAQLASELFTLQHTLGFEHRDLRPENVLVLGPVPADNGDYVAGSRVADNTVLVRVPAGIMSDRRTGGSHKPSSPGYIAFQSMPYRMLWGDLGGACARLEGDIVGVDHWNDSSDSLKPGMDLAFFIITTLEKIVSKRTSCPIAYDFLRSLCRLDKRMYAALLELEGEAPPKHNLNSPPTTTAPSTNKGRRATPAPGTNTRKLGKRTGAEQSDGKDGVDTQVDAKKLPTGVQVKVRQAGVVDRAVRKIETVGEGPGEDSQGSEGAAEDGSRRYGEEGENDPSSTDPSCSSSSSSSSSCLQSYHRELAEQVGTSQLYSPERVLKAIVQFYNEAYYSADDDRRRNAFFVPAVDLAANSHESDEDDEEGEEDNDEESGTEDDESE